MLLLSLLREFLFLQAFLYVSVDAESGNTTVDDNNDQTTTTSGPQTTRRFKAFFARDPPKPAMSDTSETSTTMSEKDKGVAIPDGGFQTTTPTPSASSSSKSPAQAPGFFARDPPAPSHSSGSSEMSGSDEASTRTTKEPESGGDSARAEEPESDNEDLRTTKNPREDVTENSKSNNGNSITTKEPESDNENSNNDERHDSNIQGSDAPSGNKKSRNIVHIRSDKSSRDPPDSRSKELPANYVDDFGQLSTNHKSSIVPHYHVQVLNSGVAIPLSPEETTTYRKKSQATTTKAPAASSHSRATVESSSQASAMQSTIIKFLEDTLKRLLPRENMRRAFDMRKMSAKTVKTLLYGIVFHFPNGTEVPDAENTCKILDRALSDNFERVKPLKNPLIRILVSAAAKFLMFRKVLSPQNEADLSDWFATCFEESLGDVSNPTEKQSMYAIGDGFVNFLDSMDLYLPSVAKVLAKYIAGGLYAVL